MRHRLATVMPLFDGGESAAIVTAASWGGMPDACGEQPGLGLKAFPYATLFRQRETVLAEEPHAGGGDLRIVELARIRGDFLERCIEPERRAGRAT